MKKTKKRKKKIKFEAVIGIGIVAIITAIVVSFVSYGLNDPKIGVQHIETPVGRDKVEKKSAGDIMFLGDSITARGDWNALFGVSDITNAGISGNTTDDVLGRLDPLLTSGPKKIFLMVGINDLLRGKDAGYVLANYETILKKIKTESPGTVVYVQSVLPVNNDISTFGAVGSQKIITLNAGLKLLAEKNRYHFIDLYPHFCSADRKLYKKYASDGLHPDASGYAVWKRLISPYVK